MYLPQLLHVNTLEGPAFLCSFWPFRGRSFCREAFSVSSFRELFCPRTMMWPQAPQTCCRCVSG